MTDPNLQFLYSLQFSMVFEFNLVWENFLPIPTSAQNILQVNRLGEVALNYLSWLLIGQNLRENVSDFKQIEWSSQDFVL
jgi:hypothetical protein